MVIFINDININTYDARLLSRAISPSNVGVERFWGTKSLHPILDKETKSIDKQLMVEIEFKGTENQIAQNKSNLIKEISISNIKFKDLDNTFKGSISSSDVQTIVRGYETVSIVLTVIEEGQEVVEQLNNASSKTIVVKGNVETPVRLEITPNISLVDITIKGLGDDIKIKNLTINKTIIIEDGLVLEAGANKFQDYDSWGFPLLPPGANKITLDKSDVNITLKYKPRWI